MKALLCELLLACVIAAPGARPAEELAYGSMLFAYYQQDFGQALIEVMVAEARGLTGADPDRLALAKGSFAFAEGLYRLADTTFSELNPDALGELDRMRLAFHSARLNHRRSDWSAMEHDLNQIAFGRTWLGRARYHPEIGFMQADAALTRGDFTTAQQMLTPLGRHEDYLGYGLFNLAVAQREAGETAAAHATLDRLIHLPLRSAPGRDLVDRGRLALAVLSSESASALNAESVLDRLPAEGRYREHALAVYADLAMARGDHRLAARIWLSLLEGNDWHLGRAAAELGLPMALEAMQAPGQALEGYRRAASIFANRIDALDALAGLAHTEDWGGRLLFEITGQEAALPATLTAEIRNAFGVQAWLSWLARADVSGLVGDWQQLRSMQDWLGDLPDELAALEEVKQERLRRTALAGEQLEQDALNLRRRELDAEIAKLNAALTTLTEPGRALDEQLILALATPTERRLLNRLDGLHEELARHIDQPRHGALSKRVERLRGAVIWDISEARSARSRDLMRSLDETRRLAADVDARLARVARAETDLAVGAAADFAAVATRAAGLSAAIAAAQTDRERSVAEAFRRALIDERTLTEQRLLTARIAIARTTDLLAVGAGAPGAGT